MEKITAELAWRVRKRGMLLPTDRQYVSSELASIADEQQRLMARMDALDRQIKLLATNELINQTPE